LKGIINICIYRIASFELEEYETAKMAFEKGQQIDPENSAFKTWIRKCNAEMEAEGGQSSTSATTESPAPVVDKKESSSASTNGPKNETNQETEKKDSKPAPSTTPSFTQSGTPKIRY
jgi:suppressor of G2 allele of SKP1